LSPFERQSELALPVSPVTLSITPIRNP